MHAAAKAPAAAVDDWQRSAATNLSAPFILAKLAAAQMARQAGAGGAGGSRGHIVNITSTSAKRAWPNASADHATRWGLLRGRGDGAADARDVRP